VWIFSLKFWQKISNKREFFDMLTFGEAIATPLPELPPTLHATTPPYVCVKLSDLIEQMNTTRVF